MSRRKKKHEHVNHERWLVSYADFITLLFAFFVVMYSSAQVDNKKVAQVSAAIEGAFQELGVFTGTGSAGGQKLPPETAKQPIPQQIPQLQLLAASLGKGGVGTGGAPDVNKLRHDLEEALGDEIKKHEIQMRVTPAGLVVSLSEVGFFASGDAILLPGGQATLTRIAGVLNEKGFQIRVEGHTDNQPIHTSRFKSNWDLSTARATEVVSLLIEKHSFDPHQISAAGYSEYRPIASNDTEEGRKANRRVDLVVVAHATYQAPPSNMQAGQ